VALAAISVDPLEVSAPLAAELGLPFPLLSDADGAVIESVGVLDPGNQTAWPSLFLVDEEGVVLWRHLPESFRFEDRATAELVLAAVREHVPEASAKSR
jgi:peroxiredoxin